MSVSLTIEGIDVHYGHTRVLEDFCLHVEAGELVSLLGASGCGKTTTLRTVAGFLQPSRGAIRLGDVDLTRRPAHKRNIGLVFQTYALFPHLTVRDNVAFGLKQRGIDSKSRRARAADMLALVDLAHLAERMPSALSGGQRQRVALARALVIDPPLMMFDEPLSNLDAKLRIDMRVEIRRLQQAGGRTALYVTHDQEEAFSISDRVAIMHLGKVMQLDTPEILYAKPANAFVADFVGFENMIPMRAIGETADAVRAEMAGGEQIELPKADHSVPAQEFLFAARADGLEVRPSGTGIPVTLGLRTYLGRAYQYRCTTPVGQIIANGSIAQPLEPGTQAVLVAKPDQCCVLPVSR